MEILFYVEKFPFCEVTLRSRWNIWKDAIFVILIYKKKILQNHKLFINLLDKTEGVFNELVTFFFSMLPHAF